MMITALLLTLLAAVLVAVGLLLALLRRRPDALLEAHRDALEHNARHAGAWARRRHSHRGVAPASVGA